MLLFLAIPYLLSKIYTSLSHLSLEGAKSTNSQHFAEPWQNDVVIPLSKE